MEPKKSASPRESALLCTNYPKKPGSGNKRCETSEQTPKNFLSGYYWRFLHDIRKAFIQAYIDVHY